MTVVAAPSEELVKAFESSASGLHWKRVGVKHHHGINVPLFSLRSSKSAGIGEFPDLVPLLRWLPTLGMDVLQLLPLNDTGGDSSPYNALSAFALNPLHLGLRLLPDSNSDPELVDTLEKLTQLNNGNRVDYHALRPLREKFLWRYYQLLFSSFCDSEDYKKFVESNAWLSPYAVFKTLKEAHNHCSWEAWPKQFQNPNAGLISQLEDAHRERVNYHRFVQYLCSRQFHQVKRVANQEGVLLKGDIPILLSRDSADFWYHRDLFYPELSAGAPPDMYCPDGQSWGFPVYNWDAIEQQHFTWWRDRLANAEQYYHLYRLDHVVGFFRIWTVPPEGSAVDGTFLPEDESLWIAQGRKILLMMLECSKMLPIGEDLGIIPDEVRECMRALKICGTKVMRWERLWKEDEQPFVDPKDYPEESLTTVSTHDSEPLKLWWESFPEEARALADHKGWNYDQLLTRERMQMLLRESHHSNSLFHINLLNEYLQLLPEMRWDSLAQERINTPGTMSDDNWSYRFRPFVEEIVSSASLKAELHHVLCR